ncbi:hypothetical protein [Streptomyces sp. NPDC006879]|uniref:hypothetical protein n=1 Tax=Streptomyces sp. NPDC006879 TaxID=3364767 RepID=UPI00369DF5CD
MTRLERLEDRLTCGKIITSAVEIPGCSSAILLAVLKVVPGKLPPPVPFHHQHVGLFVPSTPNAARRITGGLRIIRGATLELGSVLDRGCGPMRGRHRRHNKSTRRGSHRPGLRKPPQHRRGHRHIAPQHPCQRHRRPAVMSHFLRQQATDQRHPPVRPSMEGEQDQRQPIRRRAPPPPPFPYQQPGRRSALLTPPWSEQLLQEPQQRRQLGLRQPQGCANVLVGLPQSLHSILDTGRQAVGAPHHTRGDSTNLTENTEHFVVDGRLRHPEPTTQLPRRDLNATPAVAGLRHQDKRGEAHHILAADEPRIGYQSADCRQQPVPHTAPQL